jgi:hypothetical protein
MATRTRIILSSNTGLVAIGPSAVSQIAKIAGPKGIMSKLAALPDNWKHMSKREKLLYLADRLPVGYKVTLFQEPKGTRKSRSLYWTAVNKLEREAGLR